MKKDLTKQIYKDSGWQIDKDTKTTDYKPAPYCIFGEANAGKVPVGTEDGLIEFKDYNGGSPTPTELPIAYYETYDATKIISGYLTFFNSGSGRGLWYKNQNGQNKKLLTVGEYPDGYFTDANVNIGTNTLNIYREGRPTPLQYKPIIKSYTYSNADTHTFNINEEKFWTLTIPSASFGENTNVLNVRVGTVDTNNSGHLRNSFISTWEITNNNLIVRVYMKNTLGIQLDVVNVSLIIETI